MTPSPVKVSDVTLRRMLAHIGPPSPDLAVSYRTDELHSILTELLDLRSHSRASRVKVRELEWREAALVHRFGLIVRVASTSVGEYRVLKGSQGRFDGFIDSGQVTASYETIEAAQAALQSHFNASIQSCLTEVSNV